MPAATCVDDTAFRFDVSDQAGNTVSVGCEWITDNNVSTRRMNKCNKGSSDIVDSCPVACDTCECGDNPNFLFTVKGRAGSKDVGCDWLTKYGITDTQLNNRYLRWCEHIDGFFPRNADVKTQCAQTCGNCDQCTQPDGSKSLRVDVMFRAKNNLTLEDLLGLLCNPSERRQLRTLEVTDEILSVKVESLELVDEGTYTQQ